MKKVQRTWGAFGSDHRWFWNVSLTNGSRIKGYRSRCSTAKDVRAQFKKRGFGVRGVSMAVA